MARRRRLANGAAAVALTIAVPSVVGSSAGWWTSSESLAGSGSSGQSAPGGDPGPGSADPLVPDPLAPGGDPIGPDLVGLGGGLLDVDVDVGGECAAGPDGEPVLLGVVVEGPAGPEPAAGGGSVPLEVAVARQLAALVNCAGGVIGRPVEVVTASAAGSPVATREALAGLVDRGVSVVIGPSSTPTALRVAEAAAGRVAVLSPLSIEPALDDRERGRFLLGPDTVTLSGAAARHVRDRGWRRAAVLVGSDPLEDLAATTFEEAFVAGGGSITARLDLDVAPDDTVELGEQLSQLGAGPVPQPPPDLVFAPIGLVALAEIRSELVSAGLDVPVVGIDRRQPVASSTEVGAEGVVVGAPVDGVMIVGRPPAESTGRGMRLRELSLAIGGAPDDVVAASRVADAVLVALEAVDRADASDAGAVLDRLSEDWTIEGVSGTVGVWPGPSGDGVRGPIPVLGSGPDGAVVVATVVAPGG